MPFVPRVRKQIIQALDQHIIPVLKRQSPREVLVQPPFTFEHIEHWPRNEPFLKDKKIDPLQLVWHWRKRGMTAAQRPYMGFVYQGIAEHTIGITQQMAKQCRALGHPLKTGGIVVQLAAPSVIFIPPATPGNDGRQPLGPQMSRALWIAALPNSVNIHVTHSVADHIDCSHSLRLDDASLRQMMDIYQEELRNMIPETEGASLSLLYGMMCRIRRLMNDPKVGLSNTSWALMPKYNAAQQENHRHHQLCQQAMAYIESHLHDNLTWKRIASYLKISPVYFNQIFVRTTGITPMRYVTRRRIEAAKLILEESNETVNDVAQLVGFASAASFCASFKRITGESPNEFRNKNKT